MLMQFGNKMIMPTIHLHIAILVPAVAKNKLPLIQICTKHAFGWLEFAKPAS